MKPLDTTTFFSAQRLLYVYNKYCMLTRCLLCRLQSYHDCYANELYNYCKLHQNKSSTEKSILLAMLYNILKQSRLLNGITSKIKKRPLVQTQRTYHMLPWNRDCHYFITYFQGRLHRFIEEAKVLNKYLVIDKLVFIINNIITWHTVSYIHWQLLYIPPVIHYG